MQSISMRQVVFILIVLLIAVRPICAQLSDSQQTKFVIGLNGALGLSDMIKRVRDGKVDDSEIRVIAAILRNTNEVEIHRMRGAENNSVFVSPDGHSEGVYGSDDKLVKDGINDGSYNYFHPEKDALRHFSFDIAPWLVWGQSPNDPTSQAERVYAYSADVFGGVNRALKAPRTNGKLDEVNLEAPGCTEAVAIFLLAVERGKAEEMIRVVSLQEKKSDQELVSLVEKFEAGLQALVASDNGDAKTPPE